MKKTYIGLGELAVGFEDTLLICLGLGSCVGVALYDSKARIGTLAHVVLPDSEGSKLLDAGKKVMIADRDREVRSQIRTILYNHQYEVIAETVNRSETINNYSKLKPNLSLISAFLPPNDGNDFVDQLFQMDRNANAIMLVPQVERAVVMNYLLKGAREVIIEPFTDETVLSCTEPVVNEQLMKFADKVIPVMIGRMLNHGAKKKDISAKLIGGAHMFSTITEENLNIGKRNVVAVKQKLTEAGIEIVAEDTGSNVGRTVQFDPATGIVHIRTINGSKDI